ncbi:hypothetical protein [Acidiphilium iwatense]|uniref:Transmembrane protein n=1 Tax=Acidiphilium iwatense TaxID=768198 RepID=A0ABS9DUK4_9PROT|nr:hypothetical protein [Acidiphilium iwatense]MCF3945830.1 hypothetical protein [Acidiphilium iwatense]
MSETGLVLSAAPPAEWLDRYPWLPFLVIVLAALLGQVPSWIFELSTNPIWLQSGVVLGVGPGLLAGAPFGDPNVGWTNQALGHLAAQDWLHGRVPWWNPYSGIGLPLAGEMQPAALFLPFVLLLAFRGGIVWLELALQIFAGIATFCLLRRLKLGRLAALIGALLYEFNGTFAWVPGETILNVLPFLPVLLLGIEYARDSASRRHAVVLVALSIGGSILAGFPEAAYIDGLMALLWAIVRLFESPDRPAFAWRVAFGGILGLLIAAPAIVAFADFSAASDVFQTHAIGNLSVDLRGFASIILPYIYGPLGGDLGGARLLPVSSSIGGYIGALTLAFAFAGLASRRDRPIAIMLAVWIVLAAGKIFGFPPVMVLMNALPFMMDTMFFRYSAPAWELAAIILAANALEDAREGRMRLVLPLAATLAVIALAIGLAWPWAQSWHWNAHDRAIMVTWLIRATALPIGSMIAIALIWVLAKGERRRWLAGLILVGNSIILFALPQLSGVRPGRIDWPAIDFLKTHLGLSRFYALGPMPPNYSAYFEIPDINHNYLPVARNWADFVQSHLFPKLSTSSGDIFWAPFPDNEVPQASRDVVRFKRSYRYLGVRYFLTMPGDSLPPSFAMPADSSNATALPLWAGQSLTIAAVAPPVLRRIPVIGRVGVNQGTYANSANGTLSVTLCVDGQCGVGSGKLHNSPDDSAFVIGLDKPIHVAPGERFTVTVTHESGNHPVAIWLPPKHGQKSDLSSNTGQSLAGRTIQLVFGTTGHSGFKRVYSDPLMTIWRLKGAEPFYTTHGAACTLQNARLDSVTAICRTRALLIRRELFMPGWRASIDGVPAPVLKHHAIIQAVALEPGRNHVRFDFEPPYMTFGWIAFWIGIFGIAWQATGAAAFIRRR